MSVWDKEKKEEQNQPEEDNLLISIVTRNEHDHVTLQDVARLLH